MKVGVIGLGAMGSRMARNFINTGHEVYIHNRTEERGRELLADGATWCFSPKELAESVDFVLTVLTNDEASKSIWLDPEIGAIHGLDQDKVALECSTISYRWSQDLAKQLGEFNYLEAPLVGSRPQIEAKQLTILVAGEASSYHKVKSLLADTSSKAPFIGKHGKAIALKLVINALLGIQTAAFAELYTTLLQSGFNKEQVMGILPNLPVTSPIMQMMLELFAEEKFEPLFPIGLVEKDFGYATELVENAGIRTHVISNVQKVYRQAVEVGLGEQNISGILNFYQKIR